MSAVLPQLHNGGQERRGAGIRAQYGRNLQNRKSNPSFKIAKTGQFVSLKEISNLARYFHDLDTDGSGTVDIEEVTAHMEEKLNQGNSNTKGGEGWLKFPSSLLCSLKRHLENVEQIEFQDMLRIVYPKATKAEAENMAEYVKEPKVETPPPEIDSDDELDVDMMWEIWDKNGDGELDSFEFKEVLISLGIDADNPDEINYYYRQVDTDGSGLVSKEEFKRWFLSPNSSR